MKKIIAMLFVFIIAQGCSDKPQKPPAIDLEAEAKELLACTPNTPLSKGELYERAMVDFLQKETSKAWMADYWRWEHQQEKPSYERTELNGDEIAKLCGLTYDWLGRPKKITKDRCYPYQITKYDKYHDLIYENKNKTFEQFIADSEAKVYRPNISPPIYKSENYNKDVDFVIVHNRGYETVYPKDCCKLISYDEASSKKKFTMWGATYVPDNQLSQFNVLMIKTWIFSHRENNKFIPKENYRFYAVSSCGKLFP